MVETWSSRHFIVNKKKRSRSLRRIGEIWRVFPGMAAHVKGSLFAGSLGREWSPEIGPRRGSLFGEVARIVGLLSAIGIGALLHALRIIVIGAITATPSGLVHIMVSVGLGKPSGEKMYMSGRTAVESQRKKTGFLKKLAK